MNRFCEFEMNLLIMIKNSVTKRQKFGNLPICDYLCAIKK